jgi:hypothetical protein
VERARRVKSMICLSQAHTYFPLHPDDGEPGLAEDDLAYLARVVEVLSFGMKAPLPSERVECHGWVETFHLTTCVRSGRLSWEDVADLDARLAELPVPLLFLRARPETISERTVWGRRDNGFITHYGRRWGTTLEEIHRYFVEEQARLLPLFERSRLHKHLIEVDGPLDAYLDEAADFIAGG